MIVLQLYSHVPLRAQLTYLVVFFLCLYCCPSVLYVTFFFALLACFSEQRVISELCWILSAFFLLWWFRPIASLLPVLVYLVAEGWHASLDRLARQDNNNNYYVNPRSGGNDDSMMNNLHSCPFIGSSTAVNDSFASATSGTAMFNNNSVVARETTHVLYNTHAEHRHNHVWVSHPSSFSDDQSLTSASGEPTSFDSSFSNLIALIKNGLFFIGTSSQVNTLVSGMETLSVSASSLVHASLVRAPPNDDSFNDGSGDRSSLSACRCGGTGRTSRGACSCLGHLCSGCRCACLLRSESTRGPFFNGAADDTSHRFPGLARFSNGSHRWFLDVMVRLQDQFSRLALGGGGDMPATKVVLHGGKSTSDNHDIDHYDTISYSNDGLKSMAHADMLISEELSAMAAVCLSVTDKLAHGKDNGSDAEISHFSCARDSGDHAYSIGNSMMLSGSCATYDRSINSLNNGANSYGYNSVAGDSHSGDRVNRSDVEISRHDQESFNDVDTGSTSSHTSFNNDNYSGDGHLMNVAADDKGSYTSGFGAELQSESGSLRSWEINSSDHSVVNSPLYLPVINDYEESYNPFGSDDDGSSTGTAPLYSGTAVFNDESAFGTF